jgi:monooxygenase
LMLSGVPNFAYCIGYANASWTLRADLVSRYVCRLLRHMDRRNIAYCVPATPADQRPRPLLELTSGYVRRAVDMFPKQAAEGPWTVRQNYFLDLVLMPRADLTRDMRFVAEQRPADPRHIGSGAR